MTQHTLLATLALLACGTVLAQAPSGTLNRPSAQANPAAASGTPGAAAQNKVDARTDSASQAPPSQVAPMGNAGANANIDPSAAGGDAAATAQMRVDTRKMDSNCDGKVSRAEWDRYHTPMWNSMKSKQKKGLISTADLDAYNRGAAAAR